jgi:hypothetical protein
MQELFEKLTCWWHVREKKYVGRAGGCHTGGSISFVRGGIFDTLVRATERNFEEFSLSIRRIFEKLRTLEIRVV